MTRPWRENVVPIHQDDELTPASWSAIDVPSAAVKRQFDADLAAMDKIIVERGALIIDEDSEYCDTYIDETKLGSEPTLKLADPQEFGYEHGLYSNIAGFEGLG